MAGCFDTSQLLNNCKTTADSFKQLLDQVCEVFDTPSIITDITTKATNAENEFPGFTSKTFTNDDDGCPGTQRTFRGVLVATASVATDHVSGVHIIGHALDVDGVTVAGDFDNANSPGWNQYFGLPEAGAGLREGMLPVIIHPIVVAPNVTITYAHRVFTNNTLSNNPVFNFVSTESRHLFLIGGY